MYVADSINHFLPSLPVPVHWSDISSAHKFYTKNKQSNVIIARFANRCIKTMVYDHRDMITKKGLSISEHLLDKNIEVLKKGRALFGYRNVFTENCYIYVVINRRSGETCKVNSIDDVEKLYDRLKASNSLPPSKFSFYRRHPTPATSHYEAAKRGNITVTHLD